MNASDVERVATRLWRVAAAVVTTFLVSTPALGNGQVMHFDRLSLDEGLSQSTVLKIQQDSAGFLWFGTEDGLNRYDGYTFTHYKRKRGQADSLANDFIWDIAEDGEGNLWLATDGGGVAKWDRTADSFTTFRRDPTQPNSLSSDIVRTLHFDGNGMLWIGTRDMGVDRLDPASGIIQHYRHDPSSPSSLSNNEVYAIVSDRRGRVWVGTDKGLNRYDPATGGFVRYLHDPADPSSLGSDQVRALYEDSGGSLWVGTFRSGLSRLDESGFTQYRHDPSDPTSLSHDRVRAFLEDEDGRLWIGTSRGLNLMDRPSGRFKRFTNDPTNAFSLSDDYIMSLHQDHTGVMWVGTKSGGLSKWNPDTWSLGHHVADPQAAQSLEQPNVTAFAVEPTGEVWLGTFGSGLSRLDRQRENATHFRHDPDEAKSLSDDRVMSLLRTGESALWIGTMTGGLNRMDVNTGEVTVYRHDPADPDSLGANGIMALLEDRHGNIWAGTFGGGLNRLNAESQSFKRFLHEPGNPMSLSSSRATALVEDASGHLWVGTDGGGLNLLDPATGNFHRFRHDPQDAKGLSDDTIYSLHVDQDGTVWVGSRGGLDRVVGSSFNPSTISFSNTSESDGLANDAVYGIHSSADGHIWVSTNYGLSRINLGSGEVKNFHRSHGLQSEEFNFGAHYRSRTGELFFGGPNGFNAFYPGQLDFDSKGPEVVLTSVDMFNEPIKSDVPLDRLEKLELGFRDDVLGLEFAALDFVAPEANRYAYKLEGFNEEWIDLGTERRVTFTDLNDGDYVLRIKAANSEGVWNESGLALNIAVAPAPWETWWAYLLYALAATVIVVVPIKYQQRRLAREAEYSNRLEKEVRYRTEELSDRNGQLEVVNNKLLEASLTDPLTGLKNRRFLFEEAPKDIDWIRRRHRDEHGTGKDEKDISDLVFIMIDLDHFKPVNDQFGHAAGDKMLLLVRDVLLETCRGSDAVIRWGGDEFLVMARHADQREAEALAERIRSKIAATAFTLDNGQVVRTTCSIGFACYPFVRTNPDLVSWERVINLADKAMYEAKKNRDAWVGFLSTNKTAGSEGLALEAIQPSSHLFECVREGSLEMRSSGDYEDDFLRQQLA